MQRRRKLAVLCVVFDVVERRRAEEGLRTGNERLLEADRRA